MDVRRLAGTALSALLACLAAAPIASAQTQSGSDRAAPAPAQHQTSPPIGRGEAIGIARLDPNVVREEATYGHLDPSAEEKPGIWQVGFFDHGIERVQVIVDQATGQIRESWTGYQVAWQMARGYSGQFGHKLNAPYVWIPLCLIFLVGLLDWRRPWRIAHLDLLALLAFGISHVFFNDGDIGVSVPLVYPVLLYLLGRMLWIGFRGRGVGLRPRVPVAWLAVATVFLLAFRVALNVADSGVIDVGYAGVIGADRITHGRAVYGTFPSDNQYGDTYGPANYYAYVPFELALPWSGTWDDLPAAHAAAIAFDLATVIGLFFLGRRMRAGPAGRRLGVILAFAWASYPYTDFALQSNSNDSLVAALLVWALVAVARPATRGLLAGLAGMTKFAPFALAPLFVTGRAGLGRPRSWGPVVAAVAALLGVSALMLIEPAADPGLGTFWHRTVASQIDRTSPFSVWGQADLGPAQLVVQCLAALLAAVVAFVPRRRSVPQIAALAAAVTIAVEITADHWFYLYIPWFFPLVMAALVGHAGGDEDHEPGFSVHMQRKLRVRGGAAPA